MAGHSRRKANGAALLTGSTAASLQGLLRGRRPNRGSIFLTAHRQEVRQLVVRRAAHRFDQLPRQGERVLGASLPQHRGQALRRTRQRLTQKGAAERGLRQVPLFPLPSRCASLLLAIRNMLAACVRHASCRTVVSENRACNAWSPRQAYRMSTTMTGWNAHHNWRHVLLFDPPTSCVSTTLALGARCAQVMRVCVCVCDGMPYVPSVAQGHLTPFKRMATCYLSCSSAIPLAKRCCYELRL